MVSKIAILLLCSCTVAMAQLSSSASLSLSAESKGSLKSIQQAQQVSGDLSNQVGSATSSENQQQKLSLSNTFDLKAELEKKKSSGIAAQVNKDSAAAASLGFQVNKEASIAGSIGVQVNKNAALASSVSVQANKEAAVAAAAAATAAPCPCLKCGEKSYAAAGAYVGKDASAAAAKTSCSS